MPLQTALSQNSLIQPPNKRKVSAVLARTVFDEYDTNHSGSIDTREFGRLCASLGYAISKEDLEFAIRLLDSDGNGSISYEEFYTWWLSEKRFTTLELSKADKEMLRNVWSHFSKFDTDESGFLDVREFKSLYTDLVERKITDRSLLTTLKELDTNKDGKIAFNEYVNWLLKQNSRK